MAPINSQIALNSNSSRCAVSAIGKIQLGTGATPQPAAIDVAPF
jgi:hypothetical protein